VRKKDTKIDAGYTLARYFWHGGMRTTRGNLFMPTMQARNLGGASVWNSAICLRPPQFVLERWEAEHGLSGFASGDLDRHYEAVEKFMGVRPVDDAVQGPRNELFRQACNEMGYKPVPILRNEEGCKGSGECFTGCPNDAKLSMDKRGIPEVLEAGGRVYTSVAAHKLIMQGRTVKGMEGHVLHPRTNKKSHKVTIHAKCTILAAGALATPEIMQRSGITGDGVGGNLRFHPGTMVMGLFKDEVHPWSGATQGYHCLDFLEDGIKLESLWATPSLMAFRFPGFGRQFQELLSQYNRMASWDAWVSGEDSVGLVRRQRGRRADIVYNLGERDMWRIRESMAKLSEMFFSIGANAVMVGVHGLEEISTDRSIADTLRNTPITSSQMPLASNHVFGSTAMGADPTRHAVDPSGAAYSVDNLYVTDTGILPGSPYVNPMLPCMGLSHMIAENIAARY
jgi:choline dehydrogenase-like flavoprotein